MSATPARPTKTSCWLQSRRTSASSTALWGMPGRALATPLVQKLEQGLRFPPKHCARCLKACEPAKVPYCITHALIEAVKGNVEEGLFFCGANVSRLDRMRSVRELMEELMDDWRKHQ